MLGRGMANDNSNAVCKPYIKLLVHSSKNAKCFCQNAYVFLTAGVAVDALPILPRFVIDKPAMRFP
jgi:hypothetical protein